MVPLVLQRIFAAFSKKKIFEHFPECLAKFLPSDELAYENKQIQKIPRNLGTIQFL